MARDLGEGFVTIKPDMSGFRTTLAAKLRAAMAGIDSRIPLAVDTLAANRNIAALRLNLDSVTKRFRSIRVDVDVNDAAALRKISAIDLVLRRINRAIVQPNIGLKGMDRILGELIAADKLMDSFAAKTEQTSRRGAASLALMAVGARGLWGAWGALTGKVALFGGALSGVPFVRSISGLHILAETILEIGAVLIPATAAFLAFGAGAVGTVQDINRSMVALWHTTHALNQNIYPLTGNMQRLEDAVAPAVWNLFGQALEIINANTARFTTLAKGASGVVQDLGARITLALTGGGVNKLMANAVQDLAVLGDVFGNIFGTIANILRQMPGYAEILLGILDRVTKAMEDFTGSAVGQGFIRLFLLFHGFIIWAGLAVTATVALGNAMVGLAAKFGLASEGALAFNAVQFGAGIKLMLSSIATTGAALITFAGAEDIAAASTGILEGAFMALGAVSPLVWIGLVAAAIGGLVYWILRGTDATNQYAAAAQKAFSQLPVSQLGVVLTLRQAEASAQLADAQRKTAAGYKEGYDNLKQLLLGTHQLTQAQGDQLNTELGLYQTRADQQALLKTIRTDLANYNVVLKAAGGNTDLLNQAGITSDKILGANKQQLAELVIEAKAAADAQNALALGTGRAAAAQNAQTNLFLQETVPAMKKVTDAENNLLDVVLGGEQAFAGFQQSIVGTSAKFKSPSGLIEAAKLAKGNLQGLNEQSLAFVNTLYNIAIPNLQKMIVALDMQGASTKQVTTAVATGAGEILKYTGHNAAARSVIEALINNALGPGTVSLKTMDKWVKSNSTSMAGLSNIVASATIHASALAGVLHDELNAMLAQASLNALGGQKALDKFAAAVMEGDTSTSQLAAAGGKKVLAMFEKMYQNDIPKAKKAFIDWAENGLGLSQKDALALWKTLYTQLNPQIDYSGLAAKKAADKIDASFIKSLQQIGFDTPQINADVKNFSDKILATGDSSAKTAGARKKLITDLISAGVEAHTAQRMVDGLQASIDGLHGKLIRVGVNVYGTGGVSAHVVGGTLAVQGGGHLILSGAARGGPISGRGGPTQDNIPIMASSGEWVINAASVKRLKKVYGGGVMHEINSFASGGPVGAERGLSRSVGFAETRSAGFAVLSGTSFAQSMVSAFTRAMSVFLGVGGNVGQWIAASLAINRLPAWWAPLMALLVRRESGGNPNAVNPISVLGEHASGIAQMLPDTFNAYTLGGSIWNPVANLVASERYIRAIYGSPANIHGLLSGQYLGYARGGVIADRGAILRPGANLLFNKTGRNEPLVPAGGDVHIHIHNHGVLGSEQETERWLRGGISKLARNGQLTYALRRSPSA